MLIAAEIAITLTLFVGSALTLTSLFRVLRADLGFDARNVAVATLRPSRTKYQGPERARFLERVLNRLREMPGIESASAISPVPLDRRVAPRMTVVTRPGESSERRADSRMRLLSAGALDTLRVPVLRGREFTRDDRDGAPLAAMVNERLGQTLWPDRDPIGQSLSVPNGPRLAVYTIIGVTGNVRGTPHRPPDAEVYLSHLQHVPLEMTVVVRSAGDPTSVIAAARAAAAAEDPEQPIARPGSTDELAAAATAYRRFNTTVLSLFGLAAVLLAASGILAVVMSSVAGRTRELGIRMALGASGPRIIRLVVGEVSPAILVGVGAGWLAIYNLSFLLTRRGLLFEVRELDIPSYAGATLAVVAIAIVAAWLPARRAARQNPAIALSTE